MRKTGAEGDSRGSGNAGEVGDRLDEDCGDKSSLGPGIGVGAAAFRATRYV